MCAYTVSVQVLAGKRAGTSYHLLVSAVSWDVSMTESLFVDRALGAVGGGSLLANGGGGAMDRQKYQSQHKTN